MGKDWGNMHTDLFLYSQRCDVHVALIHDFEERARLSVMEFGMRCSLYLTVENA